MSEFYAWHIISFDTYLYVSQWIFWVVIKPYGWSIVSKKGCMNDICHAILLSYIRCCLKSLGWT